MTLKWILALSPVVGLGVNVVVQVALYRAVSRLGLLKGILIAFAVGGLGVGALTVMVCLESTALSGALAPYLVLDLSTYAALGYGYFHFINLGVTARRIRILQEVLASDGGLPLPEILVRYDGRAMVQNRLGRLLGAGQVVLRDGRYYIGKPVMLHITRMIIFLKLVVLGKRSEFD